VQGDRRHNSRRAVIRAEKRSRLAQIEAELLSLTRSEEAMVAQRGGLVENSEAKWVEPATPTKAVA
jgi:hypothetical protein